MTDFGNGLFEKIPDNFFSILAGPLKEVHAGLLFLIYEQYRRTIYTLPRETVIDFFCEYLEGVEFSSWDEDECSVEEQLNNDNLNNNAEKFFAVSEREKEEASIPSRSVRERANMMFRKFVDTGWLLQEQHYDYTFKVTIPDYALAVLETLDKINSGYRMEFQGKVLSIYQNLTGEESETYLALQQAVEYTSELIDGLKRLSHSIRGYTEKLLKKKDPYEIMAHIFDEYQVEVLGDQYYRLKTSEHISKYRTGILKQIKSWQLNRDGIVAEASRMVLQRQAADHHSAENMIYDWLEYIDESFRGMDGLLDEIDRRNAQYARSAVEKLRFQLQQGRGIEQSLISILGTLAGMAREEGEHDEVYPEINTLIKLFPQRVVDEFSIRTPARQEKEHQPRPYRPVEVSPEIRRAKMERFRLRVKDEINVEDINSYVDELLREKEQYPVSELPARTKEQWVRLIYILLFSRSRRSTYRLTGDHGKTIDASGGVAEVPALMIERK